jgi:hypothetical protein
MGEDVRVQANVAMAAVASVTATAAVRSYFSSQHLWAAKHFVQLAADFERGHAGESRLSVQHRAYVMGAISESVAFLEAYINELYQDATDGTAGAADGLPPDMVRLMREYWRSTDRGKSIEVMKKYDMARVFAGHPTADASRRPNDDVKYLIKLRNWLIHYRPKTISDEKPETVIDHVRTRFAENPLLGPAGESWFPNHALGSGCGDWAVRSVRAFTDEFSATVGSLATYQTVTWDEEP